MGKAYTADALATRVFALVMAGVGLQIVVILMIGF